MFEDVLDHILCICTFFSVVRKHQESDFGFEVIDMYGYDGMMGIGYTKNNWKINLLVDCH